MTSGDVQYVSLRFSSFLDPYRSQLHGLSGSLSIRNDGLLEHRACVVVVVVRRRRVYLMMDGTTSEGIILIVGLTIRCCSRE